jgi:hypothetical protein
MAGPGSSALGAFPAGEHPARAKIRSKTYAIANRIVCFPQNPQIRVREYLECSIGVRISLLRRRAFPGCVSVFPGAA